MYGFSAGGNDALYERLRSLLFDARNLVSFASSRTMQRDDEDHYVPLIDQKVFGAGIKRKTINFIPATQTPSSVADVVPSRTSTADRYLSIVLPKISSSSDSSPARDVESEQAFVETPQLCAVCQEPLSTTTPHNDLNLHESSIAHQVCLEHSHPPSHLNRSHVGLRYLEGYGWDPDSRQGLGAKHEGIRIPIKAKKKNDTAGLRERDDEEDVELQKKKTVAKGDPVIRLDAGRVRKQQKDLQKRAEELRQQFYGRDLEQYLGPAR